MTNISVIENKISSVRKYLAILASYRSISVEQLSSDVTLRGAVERYLYLLAQTSIDLAEALIALRNLRRPSTMGESFSILKEAGLVSGDLEARLIKMVGFRNILAHDYERLDYSIIHDVLQSRLVDVEEFVEAVSQLLL